MKMAASWQNVLPYTVRLHKNRTHQVQRGLKWRNFNLQVILLSYVAQNGCSAIDGGRMCKTREREVGVLFRPVVGDAPVQGDAVAELSVVAVLLVFPLGVVTVLSQSGSSSPLAQASGSLD